MRTPTRQPVSSTNRSAAAKHAAVLALVLSALAAGTAHAQPTPDSSGFIRSTDGARLYFAVHGRSRDTVIVPGGVLLANDLAVLRDNVTLVFYDPRGRGRSDWIADANRLTMGDELRDIEAIRAGLRISRAALIGFSYLGLVTALYAADNPTRVTRVALLGPMPPDEQTSSRYAPREGKLRADSAAANFARAHAAATDTADPAAECRRWYAAYLPVYLGDPSRAADVDTGFCVHKNEAPANFQWRVAQTMRSLPRRWDYSRKAAAIQAPTLIIEGDRDFASSPDGARRWAELIPNARLIMLAGAGHLTYVERQDRVIPALTRFLRGDWPPEAMQLRTSR